MLTVPSVKQLPRYLKAVIATLFTAVIMLALTPSLAHASTPVSSTSDLLQSVGGTVYIKKNIDWDSSAQYYANGSWHNVSDLKPSNPATQDGNPVDLENGWKIRWVHDYPTKNPKGAYMVYRKPDWYALKSTGLTWGGFKMRFNNIGYTASGEKFDSIVEFTTVRAQQFNGLEEPDYVCSFHLGERFGPAVAAVANKYPLTDSSGNYLNSSTRFDTRVKSRFTTTLVKTGTDMPIDSNNEFNVMYWDIDQPVHHKETGTGLIYYRDYSNPERESVGLRSGYNSALIADNTQLQVEDDANGTTWFRSSANDDNDAPHNPSAVVGKASPQFVTEWSGEGCETGMGYDSTVTIYPEWPDPVKYPESQIRLKGEIAEFDVTEDFPYVADSNKASSITMEDTLDDALDASRAEVTVTKVNADGTHEDVTSNWNIQVSGQTITAKAINTGHGYVEGKHFFHIKAPVRDDFDFGANGYETVEEGGQKYWKFPNQASMIINGHSKKTNTVRVLVPYDAKGSVVLEAQKKLQGATLQANQFIFELKDENGNVIDTKLNDGDGKVTFKELSYTKDDIGKTYTYTIEETKGNALGLIYDTHKETVHVKISDAGNGKLNVVAEYESTGGAVFTNKAVTALKVIKKSTDGSLLKGAEFTLYKDNGDGVFTADDQPAEVYSDNKLTKPITGGVVTTDDSGEARYFGLVPGTTYWLKETKAPAGYNLDPTVHAIIVGEDGTISTKDSQGASAALPKNDGIASITIADEPIPALPLTAGAGVAGLLAIGSILIAGGGGIALFRRRN